MSRSVAGATRRKRQQCTHRSITVLVHTVIVFLDGDLVSLVVWKCRVPLDKSEGVVKTEISWAVREHRLLCQRRLRTKTLEISPESLCGGIVPPTIDSTSNTRRCVSTAFSPEKVEDQDSGNLT